MIRLLQDSAGFELRFSYVSWDNGYLMIQGGNQPNYQRHQPLIQYIYIYRERETVKLYVPITSWSYHPNHPQYWS